jgi:hypothetical protein
VRLAHGVWLTEPHPLAQSGGGDRYATDSKGTTQDLGTAVLGPAAVRSDIGFAPCRAQLKMPPEGGFRGRAGALDQPQALGFSFAFGVPSRLDVQAQVTEPAFSVGVIVNVTL